MHMLLPTAATPLPSSKLSHLVDSLKLERQFLRVPFEHYKKAIHANHHVREKEISSVINGVFKATDQKKLLKPRMKNLISLVNKIQRACTALSDYGEGSALPTLWDSFPSIAVVGG
ncbi:hypothetical protein EV2_039029 [Malus domestica]